MMPEAEPRDPRRGGGRTKKRAAEGDGAAMGEKCVSGGCGVFSEKSARFFCAAPCRARRGSA